MNQLQNKVDEIKMVIVNIVSFLLQPQYNTISKDKTTKEKNELATMNSVFDRKFKNLQLREINAFKKNVLFCHLKRQINNHFLTQEEARNITQQYEKEL